jgi:hypothetical protein
MYKETYTEDIKYHNARYFEVRKKFQENVCVDRGRLPCSECPFYDTEVCASEDATTRDYQKAMLQYIEFKVNGTPINSDMFNKKRTGGRPRK